MVEKIHAEHAMLDIDNVRFGYDRTDLLKDITFSVRDGEFLTIIGPNGAGKSTLLRLLTRTLTPRSGSILLNAEPIGRFAPRQLAKLMAVVPQREEVLFPFSVRSMVMLGRYPHLSGFGFERTEDHQFVEKALALVDMSAYASRSVTQLSGGELHRVIIARALAQDTPLILLDEPNAHLDIRYQIDLFDLLRMLNRERHRTIIAVTHDLNLASMYSDRIGLLAANRLIAIDTPEKVLTHDAIRRHFGISVAIDKEKRSDRTRVTLLPTHVSSRDAESAD